LSSRHQLIHPTARLAFALVLAAGLVAGHCPAPAIAKGETASEAEPKANATADALMAADKTGITDITTDELKQALSENSQTIVIDVRNYAEGFPAWKKAGLPIEQADCVLSAIGATQPSTYENAGHNNKLYIIVTGDGVVLVNAGCSYLLA
jgi:hypothetical protein